MRLDHPVADRERMALLDHPCTTSFITSLSRSVSVVNRCAKPSLRLAAPLAELLLCNASLMLSSSVEQLLIAITSARSQRHPASTAISNDR
jgi:hypothetical protein